MWVCEKLLAFTIMVTLPATTDRKPSGYYRSGWFGGVWKGGCSVIHKNEEEKSFYCLSLFNPFY
jgi:hypothetical protein